MFHSDSHCPLEGGKIAEKHLQVSVHRPRSESPLPKGPSLPIEEILSREELTTIIGEQLGIPHIWLRKGLVDPRIVHVLPKEKALHFQVIPMFKINNLLTLATSDPHAFFVFDEVSKITGLEVQPVLCRADDIIDAIHECYQKEVSMDEVMAHIDEADIELVKSSFEREISEIAEMAEGSPVVNWTHTDLHGRLITARGDQDAS